MKRLISLCIIVTFIASLIVPPRQSYAQEGLNLPAPGSMVNLSPAYMPVLIKGLKVHPENPLLFDFILDTGKSGLKVNSPEFKAESQKLIKYFLASLTIKEDDLWVNLSPYEKDRMIPKELGQTELGRDMLAQDYILKQLTASLIYPEKQLGKEFWNMVYAKAQEQYGTTQIPVNTFNKVWIVADKAKVLERNNAAYVVGAHLKVMLEEDYFALNKHVIPAKAGIQSHSIASQVIRSIILPELEKEVNQGRNFASLRQMFYSMILASWYKLAIKNALLNQVYSNKNKTGGILSDDPQVKEKIYDQYLKAYKKGVFSYIKETETANGVLIPRKYFSGGLRVNIPAVLDRAQTATPQEISGMVDGDMAMESVNMTQAQATDAAMKTLAKSKKAELLAYVAEHGLVDPRIATEKWSFLDASDPQMSEVMASALKQLKPKTIFYIQEGEDSTLDQIIKEIHTESPTPVTRVLAIISYEDGSRNFVYSSSSLAGYEQERIDLEPDRMLELPSGEVDHIQVSKSYGGVEFLKKKDGIWFFIKSDGENKVAIGQKIFLGPFQIVLLGTSGNIYIMNMDPDKTIPVEFMLKVSEESSDEAMSTILSSEKPAPSAAMRTESEWHDYIKASLTKNPNVLLIEDDEFLRGNWERFLKKNKLNVIVAGNYINGMRLYNENRDKIGLIITDNRMPRDDEGDSKNKEWGKVIRENIFEEAVETPVILQSDGIKEDAVDEFGLNWAKQNFNNNLTRLLQGIDLPTAQTQGPDEGVVFDAAMSTDEPIVLSPSIFINYLNILHQLRKNDTYDAVLNLISAVLLKEPDLMKHVFDGKFPQEKKEKAKIIIKNYDQKGEEFEISVQEYDPELLSDPKFLEIFDNLRTLKYLTSGDHAYFDLNEDQIKELYLVRVPNYKITNFSIATYHVSKGAGTKRVLTEIQQGIPVQTQTIIESIQKTKLGLKFEFQPPEQAAEGFSIMNTGDDGFISFTLPSAAMLSADQNKIVKAHQKEFVNMSKEYFAKIIVHMYKIAQSYPSILKLVDLLNTSVTLNKVHIVSGSRAFFEDLARTGINTDAFNYGDMIIIDVAKFIRKDQSVQSRVLIRQAGFMFGLSSETVKNIIKLLQPRQESLAEADRNKIDNDIETAVKRQESLNKKGIFASIIAKVKGHLASINTKSNSAMFSAEQKQEWVKNIVNLAVRREIKAEGLELFYKAYPSKDINYLRIYAKSENDLQRQFVYKLFEPLIKNMIGEDAHLTQRQINNYSRNFWQIFNAVKAKLSKPDSAMTPGGIDLSSKHMHLDINKEGHGVEMKFDPALVASFQRGDFSGIVPVIIRITPVSSPYIIFS